MTNGVYKSMKKIIAYVHTHWDREWYRSFEDFRLRLIEVLDEVFNDLESGNLPYFYFDGQTSAIEDYLEIYPDKLEIIKQLIAEKKLRIGPFYCSADSFLVSGECLYRNYDIGIKQSLELGETEFIGYLADTFGHSRCVPYVLKAHNIDKACIWRGIGNTNADIDWDGIKTTNLIQGYFQDFLHLDITIEKKAELLKKYLDKISARSNEYMLLPIGGDHLASAKNIKSQIEKLNKLYKEYKICIGTPFEYFEKIKERQKIDGELLDNSLTFILPGIYSSGIQVKQENIKAQWLLTNIAEPIQAISHYYFNTKNRQNEINYAYKTLIKNHAHDSIYCCCIDEVQEEVLQRFKKINSVSGGIIKRTVRDLTSSDSELSVINLSNNEYTGKIHIITDKTLQKWMNAHKLNSKKGFTDEKLYNINEVPITEDIKDINEYIISVKNLPPYSISRLTEDNICKEQLLKTKKNSIENNFIKFAVNNGQIEITDKKTGKKYSDFISITDMADIGDSYNFGPLANDKPVLAKFKSYKLKEANNQRAVIELKYTIKIPASSNKAGRTKKSYTHTIKIDTLLYNNEEYIEFKFDWENKSKNHILKIGFKLKEKIFKTINEDLYGITERSFNPDFDVYKHIPAPRGKEIKTNTAPMQRFVSAQNVAVLTKGNQEYEINKNNINITLLRATGIISNPKNPSRGTPAGPPLDTIKLQSIGENSANIAIAFSEKSADLFRLADNFYNCTVPLYTDIKDMQFIKVDNSNIQITSIQTTNKGINLRLFNHSENSQSANITVNNKKIVKFSPHEIKNIDFPFYSG